MSTALSKPVTRKVVDFDGKPMIVTLTVDGIVFRRPRKRESVLLPYGAGETRAQMLAAGIAVATTNTRRKITRGVLSVR